MSQIDEMITILLDELKDTTYISTGKYVLTLVSEKEDTINGKIYQVAITTDYKGYEEGIDKE